MEKVKLGASDLSVSKLCLGTMMFGVKVEEELSFHLMDRYFEQGGRFIDTANKYSTWVPGFPDPVGEVVVGRWIRSRNCREDVVVATKMGFPYHDVPRGLTRALIIQEVDKSLKRLEIEAIDLLYAHADDYHTPQEETMRAFDDLIRQGKVREIGASNYYAWRLAQANSIATDRQLSRFEGVQTRLTILWPDRTGDFAKQIPATVELLDYCNHNQVTLLCYSPLLQGCFGRDDRKLPDQYDNEANRAYLALIREIATDKGTNGNTIVLAWMISQGFVPVITGSTLEQIDTNLAALYVRLTEDELSRMNGIFYPKTSF